MSGGATPRPLRLTSTAGIEIAADELDGRPPAILFLHGLASARVGNKSTSLAQWASQRRRRLLRLDFRGHGESTGKIEDITLTGLVADAQAGLMHLGQAIVVGSSLGGLVGAWLAAQEPERVLGLVLLAPAFGLFPRLAARPRVNGRVQIDSAWVHVELKESVFDDASAWPEKKLPERILVPTLIVHGDHDTVVPVACSEQVFAAIPHASKDLWVVADGDHRLAAESELVWPMMERLMPAMQTAPDGGV